VANKQPNTPWNGEPSTTKCMIKMDSTVLSQKRFQKVRSKSVVTKKSKRGNT
jgi:hypothetical protein